MLDQKKEVPKPKNIDKMSEFFFVVNLERSTNIKAISIAPTMIETDCWVILLNANRNGANKKEAPGGKGI